MQKIQSSENNTIPSLKKKIWMKSTFYLNVLILQTVCVSDAVLVTPFFTHSEFFPGFGLFLSFNFKCYFTKVSLNLMTWIFLNWHFFKANLCCKAVLLKTHMHTKCTCKIRRKYLFSCDSYYHRLKRQSIVSIVCQSIWHVQEFVNS